MVSVVAAPHWFPLGFRMVSAWFPHGFRMVSVGKPTHAGPHTTYTARTADAASAAVAPH